jgi:uncharacterized protein (DUF427 family)
MKALWNNETLANSFETVVVEGNHYFPPNSLKKEFFKKSNHETICPWKGTANYYDIVVKGKTNKDAAWFYQNPKPEAKNISGYVAFWKGVEVLDN